MPLFVVEIRKNKLVCCVNVVAFTFRFDDCKKRKESGSVSVITTPFLPLSISLSPQAVSLPFSLSNPLSLCLSNTHPHTFSCGLTEGCGRLILSPGLSVFLSTSSSALSTESPSNLSHQRQWVNCCFVSKPCDLEHLPKQRTSYTTALQHVQFYPRFCFITGNSHCIFYLLHC